MKKVLFLAMFFAAMTIGCTKNETPDAPKDPAAYGVTTDDATFYELKAGNRRTVNVYTETRNGNVDGNNLTVTIKADPALLDEFNKDRQNKAYILPENAYSFAATELTIYKNNKKSLSVQLTIEIKDDMTDTLYVLPVTIASITGSDNVKIADDAPLYLQVRKKHQDTDKGKGTKAEPYLIYDKADLLEMHNELIPLASGEPIYFKMMQDVDLGMTPDTEDSWEPLNAQDPYKNKVDFDGNGKKIKNLVSTGWKYASMFGVVYGEVYNVTFENAYIEYSSYAIGVVGGYIGTTNIPANVHHVKVVNSKVVNTGGDKNGVGGICGRVSESTINACSFDGEVHAARDYAGGIFGYDAGVSTVTNCVSSGKLVTTGQRTGGIGGGLIREGSKVQNCISTMGISSNSYCVGGIIGHANKDNKASFQEPHNEISGCIAWCDSIAIRKTATSNWGSGAIVGFTAPTNTLSKCYRKSDLQPIAKDDEATEYFKFIDQPDANAGNPLTVGIACDFSTTYKAPYNGTAADKSKTASQVATQIGWDTSIWDLTGDIPALK